MGKELTALTPQLEQAAKDTANTLMEIELEQKNMEKTSILVKQDEDAAKIQAQAASVLKIDCEKDLAEAIPALNGKQEVEYVVGRIITKLQLD